MVGLWWGVYEGQWSAVANSGHLAGYQSDHYSLEHPIRANEVMSEETKSKLLSLLNVSVT